MLRLAAPLIGFLVVQTCAGQPNKSICGGGASCFSFSRSRCGGGAPDVAFRREFRLFQIAQNLFRTFEHGLGTPASLATWMP